MQTNFDFRVNLFCENNFSASRCDTNGKHLLTESLSLLLSLCNDAESRMHFTVVKQCDVITSVCCLFDLWLASRGVGATHYSRRQIYRSAAFRQNTLTFEFQLHTAQWAGNSEYAKLRLIFTISKVVGKTLVNFNMMKSKRKLPPSPLFLAISRMFSSRFWLKCGWSLSLRGTWRLHSGKSN